MSALESPMEIVKIEAYPGESVLKAILKSDNIDIVSPFVSGWSLSKITPSRHRAVSLITRLPDLFHAPVAYLDNDPKPIRSAMERMGNGLIVYALPTVHAKLYLNDGAAWTGSANFTRNGFSGKQELLLKTEDATPLRNVLKAYKADAYRVRLADIDKLVRWCELGLSKTRQKAPDDGYSPDQAVHVAASFDDFVKWLGKTGGAKASARQHLYGKVHGDNNMSGHVYPAFNGVLAFLRMNKKYKDKLEDLNDNQIPLEILSATRDFIQKYGNEYRGVKGGYWRNYLSTPLGGMQVRGGAGDIIVKKCLVLLPIYMRARGLN